MEDTDDPDIYAAEHLRAWEQSEAGQWVMNHAVDQPEFHRFSTPADYGWVFLIAAKLTDRDYTFWQLKWGNDLDKPLG